MYNRRKTEGGAAVPDTEKRSVLRRMALTIGRARTQRPITANIETENITLVNPTRSGYVFTGWSGTGLEGEENMTVTIEKGSTGDREYTAHWRANRYYYYSDRQTAAPVTSPGTADDSAMGLWGLLLCASLAAGYAVTAAQRRRER